MLSEGTELVGESGKTYTAVSNLGQANVWVAAEKGNAHNIVVLKEPDPHEPAPWPKFQHEMIMHETFKNCPTIRKQVDRVLPNAAGGGPTLVLEMFETTVWQARTKRPMTLLEIKAITKATLLGLKDVHAQGLVYADLKMQNIMLNGFDIKTARTPDLLSIKLGDLGTVMEPDRGQVQPVVYRAPEVYFKGEITRKADIWSWGLIYCHLLEAQHRFATTGMYDDLDIGTGSTRDRMNAVSYAIANDYEVHGEAYFRDVPLPKQDHRGKGNQWEELRKKGIDQAEVDFLRWVMRADPRKRPTADQILASGWLDKSEDEIAAAGGTFTVPLDPTGHATIEYDPRRPKPSEAKKQATKSRMAGMTVAYEDDDNEAEENATPSWRDAIKQNVPSASALSSVFSHASPGVTSGQYTPGPYTPNAAGKEENPYNTSLAYHAAPSSASATQPSSRPPLDSTPSWREQIAQNLNASTSTNSTPWSGHASPHNITPGPWTPGTSTTTTTTTTSGTAGGEHNPFAYTHEYAHNGEHALKRQKGDPASGSSVEDASAPAVDERRSSRDIVSSLMAAEQETKGTTGAPTRPGLPSRNTGTYLSYQ